jgi:hypothetical protein
LAKRFDAVRQEQRATARPGSGKRGFAACMASTYDDYIKYAGMGHKSSSPI